MYQSYKKQFSFTFTVILATTVFALASIFHLASGEFYVAFLTGVISLLFVFLLMDDKLFRDLFKLNDDVMQLNDELMEFNKELIQELYKS